MDEFKDTSSKEASKIWELRNVFNDGISRLSQNFVDIDS